MRNFEDMNKEPGREEKKLNKELQSRGNLLRENMDGSLHEWGDDGFL